MSVWEWPQTGSGTSETQQWTHLHFSNHITQQCATVTALYISFVCSSFFAVDRNFWVSLLSGAAQGPDAPRVAVLAAPCPQAGGSNRALVLPLLLIRTLTDEVLFRQIFCCSDSAFCPHSLVMPWWRARPSEGKEKFASFYSLSLFCYWPQGEDWKGIWCHSRLQNGGLISPFFSLFCAHCAWHFAGFYWTFIQTKTALHDLFKQHHGQLDMVGEGWLSVYYSILSWPMG